MAKGTGTPQTVIMNKAKALLIPLYDASFESLNNYGEYLNKCLALGFYIDLNMDGNYFAMNLTEFHKEQFGDVLKGIRSGDIKKPHSFKTVEMLTKRGAVTAAVLPENIRKQLTAVRDTPKFSKLCNRYHLKPEAVGTTSTGGLFIVLALHKGKRPPGWKPKKPRTSPKRLK